MTERTGKAGHAVVGNALGAKIHYVIFNPDGSDMCAKMSDWPGMVEKAAGLLAGTLADHIGTGETGIPSWFGDHPFTWKGAVSDALEIKATYCESFKDPNDEMLNEIIRRGKELAWETLQDNLAALHALAPEIEKLGPPSFRMEGAEVVQIISASLV